MKANELMIGDWVKHPVYGNIQVGAIPNGEQRYIPIPLTAEILEKNGFKRGEIIPSKFYRNIDNEQIMFCPYSECYDIEYVLWNDSNVADVTHRLDVQQPMKCVHELQHALRLCGLNDLANNFTI